MIEKEKTELKLEIAVANSLIKEASRYMNLQINGVQVSCPYYMNYDDLYKGTVYYRYVKFGGKRSPEEIELYIQEELSRKGVDLSEYSPQNFRDLIFILGAGVDCSGFVYNLSKKAFEEVTGLRFEDYVRNASHQNLTGVNKVGARDLMSDVNSSPILRLEDVRSADIVSMSDRRHVITIIEKRGNTITCAHATNAVPSLGPNIFDIIVNDWEKSIYSQNWLEINCFGEPYIEGARKLDLIKEVDGIRRLHAFSILYNKET